jgi:hypothetical protein
MPITAISNLTPEWYTPECEKGVDDPTRFKLKPLDGKEYMEIMSEFRREESGEFTISSRGLHAALKYGLVGWENFMDSHGKDVKYSPHNLGKVPPIILQELAGEIINRSELGETERKNS